MRRGRTPTRPGSGLVALEGRFTVASSNKLATVIGADIKDHEVTIFDFSGATYLDDSAAMVIEQLIEIARRQETELIVMGASGPVADTLRTLDILRHGYPPVASSRPGTRRGTLRRRSSTTDASGRARRRIPPQVIGEFSG